MTGKKASLVTLNTFTTGKIKRKHEEGWGRKSQFQAVDDVGSMLDYKSMRKRFARVKEIDHKKAQVGNAL